MARLLAGFTIAVVLLGFGWSAGRAQSARVAQPDFELVVYGALGNTVVKCVKGCTLAHRKDAGPVDPKASESSVGFGCGKEQCEVFAAGWLKK